MRSINAFGVAAITGIFFTLCPAVANQSSVAIVHATQTWQATEINIRGPGLLTFHAAGRWRFNPGLPAVDANGDCRFPTLGRHMYAYSAQGGCEGQLIGRIGNGSPFVVGAQGTYRIADNELGPLFLVINDDLHAGAGKGLADNVGSMQVTLTLRLHSHAMDSAPAPDSNRPD